MDRERVTRWLRRAANGLGLWAVLVQHGLLPPAIAVVAAILGVVGLLLGTISGNLIGAALAIAAASISLAVALALLLVRVNRHIDQDRQVTAQTFRAALFELTEACRFDPGEIGNDVALRAAPRFPSDPAYTGCAAAARDGAGAKRGAAAQAELRRQFRR